MLQQADLAEAERSENLGADAVIAEIGTGTGLFAQQGGLHAAVLLHVHDGAMAGLGNPLQRAHQGAVAAHVAPVEDVAEEVLGVDADEGRVAVQLAHGEGEVVPAIHLATEDVQGEFAVL